MNDNHPVQYPDYKPTLESSPLSDQELQALDTLLLQLDGGDSLNVEMLDGYLTALLLAPTPAAQLRGADWLPGVWGGDGAAQGDSEAPFSSGKQKKRTVVLVLRHLRALDQALQHPNTWEPVFSVAETPQGEQVDAEDWCTGFLQATALDPDGWGRLFDDPELGPLLLPIALLGGDDSQWSPADRERLAQPEHVDDLSRRVPDAVLALHQRLR